MRWSLVLLTLLATGCVERALIVKSDPPGAAIYVDGELRGTTQADQPVRVAFDFYGTRTVTARRPGHLPKREQVELKVPWYQVFPLDLVTDLLWPGTLQDEHIVEMKLERRPAPTDPRQLVEAARRFAVQEEVRPQ